jgi:hypothetical protein
MSFNLNFRNSEERKVHLESLIDIPSINPGRYDSRTRYNRLDFLIHDKFGPGFVDEVMNSDEIVVFFAHGHEKLIHNQPKNLAC